jgi:hypothetical protein
MLGTMQRVDAAPPIDPEEVRAIFFVILDINNNLKAIRSILEDDDGEAEEDDG